MRPMPGDGGRGRAGTIVALCGGVVVVGAVVAILLLRIPPEVKVVQAHLAALRGKDVAGACQYVDSTKIPQAQLQALVDLNPQVFGGTKVTFPSRKVLSDSEEKLVLLDATIRGTDGTDYDLIFLLSGSGSGWKISGIQPGLRGDLKLPSDK